VALLLGALGASVCLLLLHGVLWLGKRDDRLHLYGLAWYTVSVTYMCCRLIQRATADPAVAELCTRTIISLAFVDILVALALCSDVAGRPVTQRAWNALWAFTALLTLLHWTTPIFISHEAYQRVEADGTTYLAMRPGQGLALTTLYGVLALGTGVRWVWSSKSTPTADRAAMAVGILLTVALTVNDTLLLARLIRTVHLTDYMTLTLGLGITFLITTRYNRLRYQLASEVHARTRELHAANTQLEGALATSEDARHALERQEQRVRQLLEQLPDAVVVHREGRVVLLNRAARRLLDVKEDTVAGRPVEDLIPVGDPAGTLAWLQAPPGSPTELEWRRANGHPVVLEAQTVQAELEGQPANVAILRDVTERKALQAHLITTDRLASMGTLAAGVAHEINNPLAFVWGNMEALNVELDRRGALQWEVPGDVTLSEYMADIFEGLHRVKTIVGDLKTFSRPDEATMGPLDVGEVIGSALKMTQANIRHHARVKTDLQPCTMVDGNAARLGQVMVNLLMNATHACLDGHPNTHTVAVRCRMDGDHVMVEVEDNGTGIPAEALPRIFDPFFTTKPVGEGTGLGLSICHGIVTAMGGSLTVRSRLGAGTTFTLRLPPTKGDAAPTPQPATQSPTPPWRVLVVDDELAFRTMVPRLLAGMQVTPTSGGAEALQMLERDPSQDLILCDVMMPGMTGVEFHDQLNAKDPGLAARVVFMTGGVMGPTLGRALDQFHGRVLEKPFTREQVLALANQRAAAAVAAG
jgi:PAS domain S-box-containing protein